MKILIVRFSSIGDIVLTTPIIRCLKNQLKDCEIHYLTKVNYKVVLENNPNIDKLICITKSIKEVSATLKKENYTVLIDLHHNLRTFTLKSSLGVKSYSFPKLNWEKWLLVKFKINKLPKKHIVERYFETVLPLGVKNDNQVCDYFYPAKDHYSIKENLHIEDFVAIAIGAQFATKKLPLDKWKELLTKIDFPILILGDKNDKLIANQLVEHFSTTKKLHNLCGELNLNQSASVVKQAKLIITHDTGLMHIATAFNKKIISIWGNTVTDFGMYPYYPENKENFVVHEVNNLSCRPCSKIGYSACPKKHFSCMNLQDTQKIAENVVAFF